MDSSVTQTQGSNPEPGTKGSQKSRGRSPDFLQLKIYCFYWHNSKRLQFLLSSFVGKERREWALHTKDQALLVQLNFLLRVFDHAEMETVNEISCVRCLRSYQRCYLGEACYLQTTSSGIWMLYHWLGKKIFEVKYLSPNGMHFKSSSFQFF